MKRVFACTFTYPDFKAYLNNLNTRDLTIDMDRANLQKAKRLAHKIRDEFHCHVRVFKTRRGHYQLDACFPHSLLDNILIRLLANDDMFRLQYDVIRMFNKVDTHNTLFDLKLTCDKEGVKLDRKKRVLVYVAIPKTQLHTASESLKDTAKGTLTRTE